VRPVALSILASMHETLVASLILLGGALVLGALAERLR
jgi:hypothetical protein